jgi:hypothetical protein
MPMSKDFDMVGGNDLTFSGNQPASKISRGCVSGFGKLVLRPKYPLGKYKHRPSAQTRFVGRLVVGLYVDCVLSGDILVVGLYLLHDCPELCNLAHDLVVLSISDII